MIVTPAARKTPPRTEVPPGTTRHGLPAAPAARASGESIRSFTGRPTRSRNWSAPPRSQVRVSRLANSPRMADWTAGSTRQPPGAVASGWAALARPASRSATMPGAPSAVASVALTRGAAVADRAVDRPAAAMATAALARVVGVEQSGCLHDLAQPRPVPVPRAP